VHEEMGDASWAAKEDLLGLEVVLGVIVHGPLIPITHLFQEMVDPGSVGEPIWPETSERAKLKGWRVCCLYRRRWIYIWFLTVTIFYYINILILIFNQLIITIV
jgi:hypothetical protein